MASSVAVCVTDPNPHQALDTLAREMARQFVNGQDYSGTIKQARDPYGKCVLEQFGKKLRQLEGKKPEIRKFISDQRAAGNNDDFDYFLELFLVAMTECAECNCNGGQSQGDQRSLDLNPDDDFSPK